MIIVEDKEQYYWCEWMGGRGGGGWGCKGALTISLAQKI